MKTDSKLIDLIVSQQERQKEYFLEYLRVQDLERIDLKNERYDDLRIHLDVEQRILSKIIRLSKIITNHIYDLKLKDISEAPEVFSRQKRRCARIWCFPSLANAHRCRLKEKCRKSSTFPFNRLRRGEFRRLPPMFQKTQGR